MKSFEARAKEITRFIKEDNSLEIKKQYLIKKFIVEDDIALKKLILILLKSLDKQFNDLELLLQKINNYHTNALSFDQLIHILNWKL